jgi:hypothetical protein
MALTPMSLEGLSLWHNDLTLSVTASTAVVHSQLRLLHVDQGREILLGDAQFNALRNKESE